VSEDLLRKIESSHPEGRTTTMCIDIFDKNEDFRWMDELRRKFIGDRVAVAYLGSSWSNHLNSFASSFLKKMNHRLQSDLILTSFDMWKCDPQFDKKELLRAAYDNEPTAKFILDGYVEHAQQSRLNGDENISLSSNHSSSVTKKLQDASGENLRYAVEIDEDTRRVEMYAENTKRNDRTLVEWSRKFSDLDVQDYFNAAGISERYSTTSPRGFQFSILQPTSFDSTSRIDTKLRQDGFVKLNFDSLEDGEKKWMDLQVRSSQMWDMHPLPWVRNDMVRRAGYARRKVNPDTNEVGFARSTNHNEADLEVLGLHHDFLHENYVPRITAFRCDRPADTGGESLICDMHQVGRALKPDTRTLLESNRLRYHMVLAFDSDEAYSTDIFLGTNDEDKAIFLAKQVWGHNAGFHADIIHDLTTKSLHVTFESMATLPDGNLHENLTSFGLAGNNLPYWAEFSGEGNLGPVIEELGALEAEKMNCIPLSAGDVLLFSNIRCKHGRKGFTGNRRVQVLEL